MGFILINIFGHGIYSNQSLCVMKKHIFLVADTNGLSVSFVLLQIFRPSITLEQCMIGV